MTDRWSSGTFVASLQSDLAYLGTLYLSVTGKLDCNNENRVAFRHVIVLQEPCRILCTGS